MNQIEDTFNNSRSLSIINLILAVWLIISPYILNYATAQGRWEQTVAGIIIGGLAIVHYYMPSARWTSWVNAVIALWLIIAPFITGYQAAVSFWNEIVVAVIIGVLAVWNGSLNIGGAHSHGHAV